MPMKLKYLLLFVSSFFIIYTSFAQNKALMQAQVDVVYLSSNLLEGRNTGTKGEQMAAEYIQYRFQQLGLKPGFKNDWYYTFQFKPKAHPHDTSTIGKPTIQAKNVMALLDNGGKNTIVIGAHYDHLGHGGTGSGSLAVNSTEIHNGADDNASGVAGILAIAEMLKNNLNADRKSVV